jgi:hypothetical protein
MIHYSCDFCGQPIRREEMRFEVRIEVRLACDEEFELGPEAFEDAADLPGWVEDDGLPPLEDDPACRAFRFDLCPRCQAAFLSDPLARSPRGRLNRFEN